MTWSGWEDLGGVLVDGPAVASWGPDRLDCFGAGTDNHMWHKWWDGASWSGWEDLGGVMVDGPAVASWGPDRLDCFVTGTDNHMWHRWYDGVFGWSGWEDLGGVLVSGPAVASWGPNRLDCFGAGTDNHMWHRWYDGVLGWSDWEDLGGVIMDTPAVASWGPNRLDCFAPGTDNHLWHKWYDGTGWSDWEDLGGVIVSAPAVASWGPDRLDCFAAGTDNHLWHKWYDGGWSGWEDLGGVIVDAPAAASWESDRLDCFVTGTDNHMWHKWWDDTSTTRVRRDAWELQESDPWEPTTLSYALAIRELQTRPASDPTSWAYMAAVHGTTAAPPPGATWNECQHGGWYFLPWHRMYLYYFERVVRSVVVAQGGSEDWALPYWNYDSGGGTNALPPAFRQPTLPDGTANPLFVADRNPAINAGAGLPASITSPSVAMAATAYTPPPNPGFGGAVTPPSHFFGGWGNLESTPHNDVHVAIGGWMLDPDRAALDPIFWLHHANIDRLWSVWLGQGGGRANPSSAAWLTQPFPFHDEGGTLTSLTSADVVDTVTQLGYTYEVTTLADLAGPEAVGMDSFSNPDAPPPELLGASDDEVELAGAPARVEVPIDVWSSAERDDAFSSGQGRHLYLNVEDVDVPEAHGVVYAVYVNLPDGTDPDPSDTTHYVGNVSFFGAEQIGREEGEHSAHGFRRTFDISAHEARLAEAGDWRAEGATVRFEPISLELPEGVDVVEPAAQAVTPVRVGRVSLFYV